MCSEQKSCSRWSEREEGGGGKGVLCRWWWRGRCRDFEFGLAAGTRQVFVEAQSSRLKGLLAYWLAGWLACEPSPRVWGGLALWEGKVKGTRSLLHVQKGQKSSYQIKSRAKSQRQPLKVEVEVGSCHVISHIFYRQRLGAGQSWCGSTVPMLLSEEHISH